MVGITRFDITDIVNGRGRSRFDASREYWDIANDLYRRVFKEIGMPLFDGDEIIQCTKEEFQAGYDYLLGIDVILRPESMGECTLQEKYLFTRFNTVTVEHCQDWLSLERGDWYSLKAQYYFVGYDYLQIGSFDPWVLLDWGKLQRATAQGRIPWRLNCNDITKVGARASFMNVSFDKLPNDVVVSMSSKQLELPTGAQAIMDAVWPKK